MMNVVLIERLRKVSSNSNLDEDRVEAELKGTTLLVYWHLLKARKQCVGVREL